MDHWAFLRPDPSLDVDDLPRVRYPVPRQEYWRVQLSDGSSIRFTPGLRLASNVDHPGVAAGWEIMADAAARMLATAKTYRQQVVFAVVPTKELAFEKRLRRQSIRLDPEYLRLVEAERGNIDRLTERIASRGGTVVDLLGPLQEAVVSGEPVYWEGIDGHPRSRGHRVIAKALAPAVRAALETRP